MADCVLYLDYYRQEVNPWFDDLSEVVNAESSGEEIKQEIQRSIDGLRKKGFGYVDFE